MLGKENVSTARTGDKHRYIQFCGSKSDKKKMHKALTDKYKVLPYPKGDNKNYEMVGLPAATQLELI